jgi:hypothetical protein
VYPLGGSSSCTAQDSEAAGQQDSSQDFPPICEQETGNCSALQLHLLPKYLVYNILEYMVSSATPHKRHCIVVAVAITAVDFFAGKLNALRSTSLH